MKRTLLVVTLFLSTLTVLGQTLTGVVITTDKTPVNHASVYLKNGKRIVAFGFTNKQGLFNIDNKNHVADVLEIRQMGYAIRLIPLSDYRNGQDIILTEWTQELKEVVVKSHKIRQQGDTLNYLVSSFRGKQDRTISDVIKKMPGLTVNNDGSIEYQGQRINKFYIEGMDLLGSRYAQASENLDVGKVKKVQVLENHQPVRALKDVDFSEQAALNIVLADSSKNVWNHVAELSTGSTLDHGASWFYDSRLLSMLFARRTQSITMYKANNTGKDIAQEIAPSGYLAEMALTDNGILENISLPAPCLREQRSRFNNTHLLATNWLFKTNLGNDLRLQLDGVIDKSEQRQLSSVIYTTAGGAQMMQDISVTSHHQALSAEILYKQNTEHQYLTNNVSAYMDFDYSSGSSVLNGTRTTERVEPRQSYVSDKLSFVHDIKGKYSVAVNAYLSLNELPEYLLLTDSTAEHLKKRSLLGGFDTRFGHKVSRLFLSYHIGTDFKIQRQSIHHTGADTCQTYREWRSFITPSVSYISRQVDAKISFPIYITKRLCGKQHKNNITLEPTAFIRYQPVSSVAMTLNYDYSWIPEGLWAALSVPVYTDYVSIKRGWGKLDETMTHTFRINTEYKDVLHGFFASVGFLIKNLRNQRLYSCHVSGNICESYATDLTDNSTSRSINARVSESWNGSAKLTTTFAAVYHLSNYNMLLNNHEQPFQMEAATLSAGVSASPLEWLSIEYHGTYFYSHQRCQAIDIDIQPLQSFGHQMKCFFLPGKFQIEWNNEIYHSNDRSVSSTYFADLSISYRTKRYAVGLSCNNILGKNDYERRQLTNTQQVYTLTRLRPREILLNIEFNI